MDNMVWSEVLARELALGRLANKRDYMENVPVTLRGPYQVNSRRECDKPWLDFFLLILIHNGTP